MKQYGIVFDDRGYDIMQWLFEHLPILEVWVRMLYKKALEIGILKTRIIPNEKASITEAVNIEELRRFLNKIGLKKGDVLIVHSSMKGIKGFGLKPDEIIEYLKEMVGNEGILLMPSYPLYQETDTGLKFEEVYQEEFQYDIDNTPSWTGIITDLFWRSDDVYRSRYPNNTLSAWGNQKEIPFADEMESDLAFGIHSAWKYCVDKHAKVLFLGIHAHHALSEIHIAEDYLDDKWPIKGWYATKTYRITSGDKMVVKKCRVRKKFWTKYMTEYNGCYRLRKKKLLIEGKIGNINYSVIPDLYEFESYVEKCALKDDLLYFKIPKKYRKTLKGQ